VALSRAREYLCLSRAASHRGKNRKASDILFLIAGCLPRNPGATPSWRSALPISTPRILSFVPKGSPVFKVRDLDVYIGCPRKYHYERVLGLGGKREDSAYVQFHQCVYRVLHWMGNERSEGNPIDRGKASAVLAEVWSVAGPREHVYEDFYRASAEAMVGMAIERATISGKPLTPPTWEVSLPNGKVSVAPDFLEEDPRASKDHRVVLRFRTGRPSGEEPDDDIDAIYQMASDDAYGPKGRVEVMYLSTGETRAISMSRKKIDNRLDKYNAAMAGICSGIFPASPDDWVCPRCPHYFICPAGEES